MALCPPVLSRASWSFLAVSRVLLEPRVRHRVPSGPIRLVINETLERRWGEQCEALEVYRDPVRSSHGHFVKAQGLRGVSLRLWAEVPWARPRLCLLRRGRPDRERVVVGDRTYATLRLRAACQGMAPVTFLTRLRLDAVLPDPLPPRRPGPRGRPRVVGARQPLLRVFAQNIV